MSIRKTAVSLKSDKRYKDAPRYPVIYQYEDDFKKDWRNILALGIVEFKLQFANTITGKREIKKAKNSKILISNQSKEKRVIDLIKRACQKSQDISDFKIFAKAVGLTESSVERIILQNLKEFSNVIHTKRSK